VSSTLQVPSGASPRIQSFSQYCRQRYGHPLGKIPLDIGLPCPNRAQGGCIFCRPASFTPTSLRPSDSLTTQLLRGKRLLIKGRFHDYLGYFQQESCTALPTDQLLPLLEQVLSQPDCRGLILSTRPDCIAPDLPAELSRLIDKSGKDCLIELGLQSAHERSLHFLNRNHSFADFTLAVERIAAQPQVQIGVHLILGLPGENRADMLQTLQTVCALPIHALKLHHLQVIRGTHLHTLYKRGEVPVFSLKAYMELLTALLPHIPESITLHRIWSSAHPDLLIAPKWNVLAAELSKTLHATMQDRNIFQGQALTGNQA